MHGVLIGVVKSTINLWISSSKYMNKKQKEALGQRLLSIKPPSYISSRPRELKDISKFKANELRNFLLYYSRPCLAGILDDKYTNNFQILSSVVYCLLQTEIDLNALEFLQTRLLKFVFEYENLYDSTAVTMNIHMVTHLVENVKHNGPLWSHSMFAFESINGKLVKYAKGRREILHEIALKYILNLENSESAIKTENRNKDATVLQNAYKKTLDAKFVQLLADNEISIKDISVFSSVKFNNLYFTSIIYTRAKKSCNYFVALNNSSFGAVQFYFKFGSLNLLLIQLFKEVDRTDQFIRVTHEEYHICEISQLENVLMYMKIGDKQYVVNPPNNYEKD